MGRPIGRRRSREVAALSARLHDVSAGLAVGIALLKGAIEDVDGQRHSDRGLATFEASLTELRRLAANPLQAARRPKKLTGALTDEAKRAGVDMELEVFGDEGWLDQDEAELLYLAGREGIRNVMRHSSSRRCRITLDVSACPVSFRVRDWGSGILTVDGEGQGLGTLRELAATKHWVVDVRSLPGMGTGFLLVGRGCPGDRSGSTPSEELRSEVADKSLGSRGKVAQRRPIRRFGKQIA